MRTTPPPGHGILPTSPGFQEAALVVEDVVAEAAHHAVKGFVAARASCVAPAAFLLSELGVRRVITARRDRACGMLIRSRLVKRRCQQRYRSGIAARHFLTVAPLPPSVLRV